MKIHHTALFGILILVGSAMAAPPDPTGTWRVKSTFGNRTRISMLQLAIKDGRLTGSLFRRPGEGTPLDDLRLRDNELTFSITRRFGTRSFTTHYTGVFREDTFAGRGEFRSGDESRSWSWSAERSDPSLLTAAAEPPPVEADIDLTAANYIVWRDHILPAQSEMAWAEIPWLSTFKDGILAADAAEKPLLFWTMNGHPLGCT